MSGIESCMKETNCKAQLLYQSGNKTRANVLMSWYKAAQAELAELRKDRERFEFIAAHHDDYEIHCCYMDKWEREDDHDGAAGYYCWKVDTTSENCGYIYWSHGPHDTIRAAIDAAMET